MLYKRIFQNYNFISTIKLDYGITFGLFRYWLFVALSKKVAFDYQSSEKDVTLSQFPFMIVYYPNYREWTMDPFRSIF